VGIRTPVAVFALICSGCSLVFVRPTPDSRDGCWNVPPALDLAAAGGVALLSWWAAGIANSTNGYNGCYDGEPSNCRRGSATVGYWMAGGLVASAAYGFVAGAICHSRENDGATATVGEALNAHSFGPVSSAAGPR
jgi:hypothetical protein